MQKIILNRINDIKKICKELKIKKFYVFGSATSDNFNNKSDIDILISFKDNLSVEQYTKNYFELHYKLRELFNREIDIVTEKSLSNPYFIQSVNETKKLIYEA